MQKAKQRLTSLVIACVMMIVSMFAAIATLVMPQTTALAADTEIVFELGANGSASHYDGNEKSAYSETVDGYTLSITGASKMYTGARDAKGNSCIKLGTSKAVGKFSFTVPADVTNVIIKVAKYKANTSNVKINGTTYALKMNSNDGAYDTISVDATTTKNISLESYAGDKRAMVNTITFVVVASEPENPDVPACEHNYEETSKDEPTCTEPGSTTSICSLCGEEKTETVAALGHNYGEADVTDATCTEAGVKTSTCGVCGYTKTESIDKIPHSYNANGVCSECGAEQPLEATITFDNTNKIVSSTDTEQVWQENGITINYYKQSSSNFAEYAAPARFYQNTGLKISAFGNITKIVFDCNNTSYATALQTSIGTVDGAIVSVDTDKVTVVFPSAVADFTIAKLTAQVRMDSLTVYCEKVVTTDPIQEAVNAINANLRLAYEYTTKTKTIKGVVDKLDKEFTGNPSSYKDWSGKTATSQAVYAGQSSGDYNSIQLRSKDSNSGIVTTVSGGKATLIMVDWNSNTESDRVLNVYGSNTAYTAATDLYDANNDGELLGTIAYGQTELEITKEYAYIGIRSASGALYLNSVEIVWEDGSDNEISKTVMNTSKFWLQCAVDVAVKDIENIDTFGIMVGNNKYTGTDLITEGGKVYVVIYLGDMFEDINRFSHNFAVRAYVTAGETTYTSTSINSLSVATMIKTYVEVEKVDNDKNGLKELYDYLVAEGKIKSEEVA